MGRLVLQLPDGSSLDIPLDRERITIGRRADNDICLPYPAVSGAHAAVVTIVDDSFLEDLNSTNGTLVNGKPIAKHFLRERDEIEIGRQKLVYREDSTLASAGVDDDVRNGRTLRMNAAVLKAALKEREEHAREAALAGDGASGRAPPALRPESPFSVRVLAGASAGRVVPVGDDELVVGRIGERIVAIRRDGERFILVALEGSGPVRLNGKALPESGSPIVPGDRFELVDALLEFVDRRRESDPALHSATMVRSARGSSAAEATGSASAPAKGVK